MEVTVATRATQSSGEFWEMVKALGDRLPKNLGQNVGYQQDPKWFNDQVARLVQLDRHSETARQLEAVLAGKAQMQHIETTTSRFPSTRNGPTLFVPSHNDPVEEQLRRFLDWNKKLDGSSVAEYAEGCGEYAQTYGLYVVPKIPSLAEKLNKRIKDPFGADYGELIEEGPFNALFSQRQRKFQNYRKGQMGPDRLRLVASAKTELLELGKAQPKGDFLVFPADTGTVYAGYRADYSRDQIERAKTPRLWSIDPYTGAWMVYGNPRRFERPQDLIMYCPGAEYRFGGSREFGDVLCFIFGGGGLYCGAHWSAYAFDAWGPAFGVCR